jgi:DUF1707 SHOCT-like domain
MPVTPGPQEPAAAGRGQFRASHADREQVIGVLKAAFVHERLAKDEFELLVGQAFAARTRAELAVVTASVPAKPAAGTASFPAEPAAATPPAPGRARTEPRALHPGPVIAVATAVCATVWMFVFLMPWPKDAEGDPPHAVAVLLYLTTLTYLLVLAMTLWLGGAVLVESWLKRRSARTRARRAS